MPMPKEMKEKMFEFTQAITDQIQDINGNPALSAEEKRDAIRKIQGGSMAEKMAFLEKNFRTGPGLLLKKDK